MNDRESIQIMRSKVRLLITTCIFSTFPRPLRTKSYGPYICTLAERPSDALFLQILVSGSVSKLMGHNFGLCKENIISCELCRSLPLDVFSLLYYVADSTISERFKTHYYGEIVRIPHAALEHTGST